jgi:hypothetical protein
MCPPVENVAIYINHHGITHLPTVDYSNMPWPWQQMTMMPNVLRIGQFEYTIIHSCSIDEITKQNPCSIQPTPWACSLCCSQSCHPRPFSDKTSIWKDQFGGSTCLWRTLFNEESRVQFCWKRMRAVQWQYLPTRIKYLKTDQLQGTGLWFSDCRVLILERIIDKDA